ncbi:MAG: FAD-dependent oxidoreductase [Capsulimonadaceae bacterium]
MKVLVVGAGLAGLTCALHLLDSSADVLVLEASDEAGGRVRSDWVDGYVLDRGFQVLLDCFPAVVRTLDTPALGLRAFDPGVIVCRDAQQYLLTDPLRHPSTSEILQSAASPFISPADKVRLLKLANDLRQCPPTPHSPALDALCTREYLRSRGFSEHIIADFFAPFFGGILLDRSLSASAAVFVYYFQMLMRGRVTLPRDGMGAVARQLSAPLEAAGRLRLSSQVARILRDGPMVCGVKLRDGEEIGADAVVVATDAPTAFRLTGVETPPGALAAVTIYFGGNKALSSSRMPYLNANSDAFVNSLQLITNVAPSYAPPRRHLISAGIIGLPEVGDEALAEWAMADIRRMLAPDREATRALAGYGPLRVYRVPYAQFPQPPGTLTHPAQHESEAGEGLFFAGEWTEYSSIDGAIASGERCANAVAESLWLAMS